MIKTATTSLFGVLQWIRGRRGRREAPTDDPSHPDRADKTRLRELMGLALSAPTVEAVLEFSAFASRLKRLGPYNVYMVYAQRPGARAIATRADWAAAGQIVRADAIPILILRPKGPITQVFELADTLPQREKDPRTDPFAAVGLFDQTTLHKVITSLAKPTKRLLKVDTVLEDFGAGRAGQIVGQRLFADGNKPLGSDGMAAFEGSGRPWEWRIKINRRLTTAEQFATLVHELGHLFSGHLGAFDGGDAKNDEYGWPDRRGLPHPVKEIEAELIAWHVCDRFGLTTGSALYLRPHLEALGGDIGQVDLDRVIRSIARVEHYLPASHRRLA